MQRREFWAYSYLVTVVAIGVTLGWRWDQILVFNRIFMLIFLSAVWLALALIVGPFVLAVAKLAKIPVLGAWADAALAIGLMILLFHAFYLIQITNPANLAAAKAYAKIAEPALEHYYQGHHRYPSKLSDLDLPGSAPFGLSYFTTDSGPLEWGTGSHLVVNGSKLSGADYAFEFGDWYFLGDDRWELGGL
jgi:hypothetical protein